MINKKQLEQFFFSKKLLNSALIVSTEQTASSYWKKPRIVTHNYLLEFPEIVLLSQIHFIKPSAICFSIEISSEEQGTYIPIGAKHQCTEGALKAISIGFLPCKFIRVFTYNDKPFPNSSDIKCFGLKGEYIQLKHGKDSHDILYTKTYDILYN